MSFSDHGLAAWSQPSNVGTYEGFEHASHMTYARRLASYIKDASTIRARTMDEYGRAPTIDQIKEMQAEHRRMAQMHDYGEAIEENDFQVDTLFREPENKKAVKIPPFQLRNRPKPIDYREVIAAVANSAGYSISAIVGNSRIDEIAAVRCICICLLSERGNSFSQIGKWLGGRDHTTISHSKKRLSHFVGKYPSIGRVYHEYRAAWGLGCADKGSTEDDE